MDIYVDFIYHSCLKDFNIFIEPCCDYMKEMVEEASSLHIQKSRPAEPVSDDLLASIKRKLGNYCKECGTPLIFRRQVTYSPYQPLVEIKT